MTQHPISSSLKTSKMPRSFLRHILPIATIAFYSICHAQNELDHPKISTTPPTLNTGNSEQKLIIKLAYIPEYLIKEESETPEKRKEGIESIAAKVMNNSITKDIDFFLTDSILTIRKFSIDRNRIVNGASFSTEVFSEPNIQFINTPDLTSALKMQPADIHAALREFTTKNRVAITINKAVYVSPRLNATADFIAYAKDKDNYKSSQYLGPAKIAIVRLEVLNESLVFRDNIRKYSTQIAKELNTKLGNEAIKSIATSKGIDVVFQDGVHGIIPRKASSNIDISLDILQAIDAKK